MLSVTISSGIPPSVSNASSRNEKSISAHLQSSVFKLSKDLIDSIHEEGIVAYTSLLGAKGFDL